MDELPVRLQPDVSVAHHGQTYGCVEPTPKVFWLPDIKPGLFSGLKVQERVCYQVAWSRWLLQIIWWVPGGGKLETSEIQKSMLDVFGSSIYPRVDISLLRSRSFNCPLTLQFQGIFRFQTRLGPREIPLFLIPSSKLDEICTSQELAPCRSSQRGKPPKSFETSFIEDAPRGMGWGVLYNP